MYRCFRKHAEGYILDIFYVKDAKELLEKDIQASEQSCGLEFVEPDYNEVGQCEYCDCLYDKRDEVLGGRDGNAGFCSDDCRREADDDIRIGDIEAQREYELYGNDMDSWYR